MDQLVQCPVCTLFLHNGMSLESHLDTHPKDQVIKALCNFSKNSNYGSRTPTPLHSERSYRSRSRTPAEDSMRWSVSRSAEHDRYWRRTPSRTPKPNSSRVTTPTSEVRMPDINFDNSVNNLSQYNGSGFMKNDKTQPTFIQNSSIPEFDQPYVYYQDHQEDREVKYSRSAEYTALDSANNVFTYNMQSVAPGGMKLQTTLLPSVPRRSNDLVKLLPKPNNILVKTNVGGVQYIAPGVKPMHMMVPTAPTFVQKNVQSNMIMSGGIPTSQMLENKPLAPPLNSSQYNQTSNSFTPGTTVVTQNSQIIYREMVHNIDGKPFISSMPAVLSGHENVTNMAQTSSMYQNVMVVDQFGNTSCMYSSPQSILPKPANTQVYNNNVSHGSSKIEKSVPNMTNDFNKTLVIEVGPIVPSVPVGTCEPLPKSLPKSGSRTTDTNSPKVFTHSKREKPTEKEGKNEAPGSTRGLKILSNIKVEVPVQHNKNMLNTILDLTGPNDGEYQERPISPGKILPDLEVNSKNDLSDDVVQSTSSEDKSSSIFSVIKNVGNPPSYKDSVKNLENKIDAEFSDSCPVPDLICNEKPSISPCSELSENGENSTEPTSLSPKPRAKAKQKPSSCKPSYSNATSSVKMEPKVRVSLQPRYSHPLRLNNLYVKKSKKVLQIKNSKNVTATATSTVSSTVTEPIASSSSCRSPENFTVTKLHHERSSSEPSTLQTISIEKIKDNDIDDQDEFDADTEEQSMDIEPVPPSSLNSSQFSTSIDIVQVKEEINSSNESGFKNEPGTSERHLTQLETLRPINVITYGNMSAGDFDDESNHRELLELEAASKSKQFVNMMNDNYFGDNIYADYFTPDRSFEERESSFNKDGPSPKEYLWGEPSQKESEFVLPNFIHESYKIAESNVEFGDMSASPPPGDGVEASEADGEGRDSKADVLSESRSEGEPPLDICADERMPPRGELSGQESNGDMESTWTGMYTDVTPAEPYDLIARESWVSDGSEVDQTEKRDPLEDTVPTTFSKSRLQCGVCGAACGSPRELRSHRALHAPATTKTSYSRMVTARTVIKKEEKPDEGALNVAGRLSLDSKEAIPKSVFKVFDPDPVAEDKTKIERLIKQEPKRRRKDYVCPTCKVDQVTESAFHVHLKLHPLECLTCGKCFFRRANLALHIKTHLGIKNYKCEVCEKRFLTRQKLSEHHNVHTGRAPVKCTVCDDTFRRYSNMVQHRDRHHFQKKGKVRDFVCQCGAVFHSPAKLLWHRETHDQRPKACLYCSDKFVHAASLTRHVRRSHNEYYLSERAKATAENVPCPVCKQVYLRSNLRTHLLTHSGKRPYHCVVCNKSFTTKWNLKLHRWTHMSRSAKPYKCSLCKGAFIRQTEYIAHMNAHKSVRPYTCNYCGCQFIRKYNCQRHVREHEMAKKYVCKVPECGKSFHRSYYLSEHMKVHSGARPFSCSICGKTSSNKSNHNKHVKIHHAREPIATEA